MNGRYVGSVWRVCVLLTAAVGLQAQTPVGTAFKYQGRLTDGGSPANGDYDFVFRLFDDPDAGTQVGSDEEIDAQPVSNGLFAVELDFGLNAFTGDARWLDVSVRPDGSGEYAELSPRQPLNATPYALYSLSGPGSGSSPWQINGSSVYYNGGKVGIGASSPVWELEVANYTPGDGAESGVTANDAGGALAAYSSTLPFPFDHFAGRVSLFSNAGTLGLDLRADAATGDVRFYTGGGAAANERMRIDASGRVGIGTNSTNAMLQVERTVDSTADYAILGSHPDGVGVQGSSEDGYGIVGLSGGTTGIGVYGWATATSGETKGVFGAAFSPDGYAGYFNGRGYFASDVGIRVQDPQAALDVENWDSRPTVRAVAPATGSYPAIRAESASSGASATAVSAYLTSASPAPGAAAVLGQVNSTTTFGYGVKGSHAGSGVGVYGVSTNGTGVYGKTINGAYAGYFDGAVSMKVLMVTGADVAEKFPVSEAIEPGTVVEIDPDNPGQLRIASGAYNRRVAGVASGAGDIPTGTVLGNLPGSEDAPAIALSGRVWVKCDASQSAIEVGDLLTTSDTTGHAMAVRDFNRAHGTVIGKAMTRLVQGETGMVLVLVSLQ